VKKKHDIRQIVPENEDDEESNHPSDDCSRDPTPGPQEQAHLPNEASGKVWLGEDLQEEEVLTKHHLGINQTYGFISCLRKECGTQLSREKWRDHLARMHNDKVKAEEEIVINGMFAQCLVVAIPAGCGPVSGLKLHSGLKCNLCNLFSTSKDALKNHFYKSHPEDQRASVSAWAQRLTATTAYFLVGVVDTALSTTAPRSSLPVSFGLFLQVTAPPAPVGVVEEVPQENTKEQWMAMFAKPAPQQPALQQHDIPLFFKNILMSTPPAGFSTPRQLYLLAERKDVEEPLEVICEAYWQKIYGDINGNWFLRFAAPFSCGSPAVSVHS